MRKLRWRQMHKVLILALQEGTCDKTLFVPHRTGTRGIAASYAAATPLTPSLHTLAGLEPSVERVRCVDGVGGTRASATPRRDTASSSSKCHCAGLPRSTRLPPPPRPRVAPPQ